MGGFSAKGSEKGSRSQLQHWFITTGIPIGVYFHVVRQSKSLADPVDLFFSMTVGAIDAAGQSGFSFVVGVDAEPGCDEIGACPGGPLFYPVFRGGGNDDDGGACFPEPTDLRQRFWADEFRQGFPGEGFAILFEAG